MVHSKVLCHLYVSNRSQFFRKKDENFKLAGAKKLVRSTKTIADRTLNARIFKIPFQIFPCALLLCLAILPEPSKEQIVR